MISAQPFNLWEGRGFEVEFNDMVSDSVNHAFVMKPILDIEAWCGFVVGEHLGVL